VKPSAASLLVALGREGEGIGFGGVSVLVYTRMAEVLVVSYGAPESVNGVAFM
jgi:hypothetical protein